MDNYQHLKTNGEKISTIITKLKIPSEGFTNKIALVTGGSRGLGKELVLGLAFLGAQVYFIDKRKTKGLKFLKRQKV